MSKPFVHIENLTLKFRNKTILNALCWQINKGEQWLLTGTSGSGKTILAKIIAGILYTGNDITINYSDESAPKTLYVAQWYPFKDKQGTTSFYYQQRYNSSEAENCNTVWDEISSYCTKLNKEYQDGLDILKTFDLFDRKEAPLLQLSSGEHKKLQLCKAFLLKPQLLILDNPYTGLDVATRKNLNNLINECCSQGIQLILISNDGDEPSCINRFARLEKGKINISLTKEIGADSFDKKDVLVIPEFLREITYNSDEVIKLKKINIKYGEKQILKDIDWTISKGEKWLLQGPNGSGKSTLLSLLNGDNPQAYANNIQLFGRKRGTGESIWDIKKNIGFISPELQWYFEPSSTVFQAVASGFFDTNGLFRTVTASQTEKVKQLLVLFELKEEENTLLQQLPLGKQRLALLARAVIKNPPLLILDEPCQGLDQQQTALFNNLVNIICTEDRSLIYVGHFENQLPNCIEHRLILNKGITQNIY